MTDYGCLGDGNGNFNPGTDNLAYTGWWFDNTLTTEDQADEFGARVVDQWINSPGHYANMTGPTLTRIGVGVTFYYTANGALILGTDQWFHNDPTCPYNG